MIIASLAIFPTSEGASVSQYVKEVIKVIENSGLKSSSGGMSTTIEAPDQKSLSDVIEKTHKKLVELNAPLIFDGCDANTGAGNNLAHDFPPQHVIGFQLDASDNRKNALLQCFFILLPA